ncbi:hypothetical protein ST45_03560 [Prevotella pectinovora]|uniref:Uncharacterized protein n=1 Tax=Prevotella pectinovora TaxID=1602169 RepID=A0A0D0IYB0_9BACT|nr:hypothetical protein ST45_03560 [Prevotella pectinovora]KIP64630.1 hypothetical protein ST44_01575 [Prevotella pectinovora]
MTGILSRMSRAAASGDMEVGKRLFMAAVLDDLIGQRELQTMGQDLLSSIGGEVRKGCITHP